MALRRGSIRLRILLLILVPLLSLVGLYAFVASITVRDATSAARTPSLRNNAGEPVLHFLQQIERERALGAVYAAKPTAAASGQFHAQQTSTDRVLRTMNAALNSIVGSSLTSQDQKTAIRALLADDRTLGAIRSQVVNRSLTPLEIINRYDKLTADIHLYMMRLAQRVSPEIKLQAYGLFQIIASLEYLAQEDAIIEAGAASGTLPPEDRHEFIGLVSLRREFADDAQRNLGPQVLPAYSRDIPPEANAALSSLEDTISNDLHQNGRVPVDPATWGKDVGALSKGMGGLIQTVAINTTNQGASIANRTYLRLGLAGGLGLVALLASVFISIALGRGLVGRLGRLRDSAMALASERLPQVMARLRAGEEVRPAEEAPAMQAGTDEIGQVGHAFNIVQWTAIEAAVDQANLRRGISDVFRNLARRSQSLLHRQLALLDAMERRTSDPDELADQYRLDHLTTRMRRHAESLIILSGAPVGRSWRNPVRFVDVLRAAVAEVEDYTRVSVHSTTETALAGQAVADMIHMIAELVENATLYSPPNTPVRVVGDTVGNGFAVEIEDRGLGMSQERLAEINHRLANPPEFDLFDSNQLGLFVAGQLARRHGVKISMRTSPFGGTTAIVLIPQTLIVHEKLATIAGPTANAIAAVDASGGRSAAGADDALVPASPASGRKPRPRVGAHSGNGPATDTVAGGHYAGGTPDGPRTDPPAKPSSGQSAGAGEATEPGNGQPSATPHPSPGAPPDTGSESTRSSGHVSPVRPRPTETESMAPDVMARHAYPAASSPEVTDAGLPRRVRQANLAPALRTDRPRGRAVERESATTDRSPEQTRAMMSSLQRGWERGRSDPAPTGPGADGGRHDETADSSQ